MITNRLTHHMQVMLFLILILLSQEFPTATEHDVNLRRICAQERYAARQADRAAEGEGKEFGGGAVVTQPEPY